MVLDLREPRDQQDADHPRAGDQERHPAAVGGVEVEDPGVVSKSWPGYWPALEAITATGATSTS